MVIKDIKRGINDHNTIISVLISFNMEMDQLLVKDKMLCRELNNMLTSLVQDSVLKHCNNNSFNFKRINKSNMFPGLIKNSQDLESWEKDTSVKF